MGWLKRIRCGLSWLPSVQGASDYQYLFIFKYHNLFDFSEFNFLVRVIGIHIKELITAQIVMIPPTPP